MKSKIIKALIICVIVAGVGTGGYFGYKKVFAAKTTVSAVSYITMKASKMNLKVNIQGTGPAYAANSKEVAAGANGTLSSLNVKVGDTVKAGDTLFTVDSDQLKQNVTRAQTSLDKLKLQLAQTKSEAAAAAAAEAEAAKAAASKTVDSTANTSTGAASLTQTTAYTASTGNNSNTSIGGNSGNNQSGNSKVNYEDEIARMNLDIAAAQKDLTAAKDALNKATVKAPINGIVVAKTADSGDNVQSNAVVVTIMDMSSTKVKVAVDELDIEKVKVGQKAEIKFDAIKDKTYEGTVEDIAITGKSSNNVTTYDVVVGITDPSGIRFGMNANVNILVDSKENVLVIPSEALIENNGRKFVRVEASGSTKTGQTNQPANAQTSQIQNQQSNQNEARNSAASGNRQSQRANMKGGQGTGNAFNAGSGRLVEIKTGIQNENYIEVLEGISEGQKLLVALPQTSTTTNNNNRNNMGGLGNFNAGGKQQGPVSVPKNNSKNK